jgi:hypothetical protein
MIKFFNRLFNSIFRCNTTKLVENYDFSPKTYCVSYIIDDNPNTVYNWIVTSSCVEEARYDFWDSHNEKYHDIIDVVEVLDS